MSTNTSIGAAAAASAAERSQRSVFVGNIPYEATEEELKDLFSQVGPVVGFRLVFDRETGKPKGYGFCEYLDQETAMSALRNLNQFEFHGRNLRVDTAAGDRSKEELRQLQMTFGGPAEESPYGAPVEPPKAPEAISRAVASLPPEQMFELMKQMKLCIQNNPNEARNMLLQNPQLAYALLQAQVVMRIVDPQVAMTMLHRETAPNPMMNIAPPMGVPQMPPLMPPMPPTSYAGGMPPSMISPSNMGGGSTLGDMDYRMIQSGMPPMFSGGQSMNLGGPVSGGFNLPPPIPPMPPMTRPSAMGGGGSSLPSLSGLGMLRGGGADEQERAALIMQVLALTDDQIALLPSEQKQSVLILRDQLRSSQQ